MTPLPNQLAPFVSALGKILSPWNFYLQQFTQAPPDIVDVDLTTSPFFNYTAKEPGCVCVSGGTIIAISLVRGQIAIDVSGQKLIPVAIADTVVVNFSVLPDFKFLPSYGQNTGG